MPAEPTPPAVDIVIPFYKNASLVAPLFESLTAVAAELASASCSVVAVNDSPDDPDLEQALTEWCARLEKLLPCRLWRNERNLGFVRSVNQAARAAVEKGRDVLLLNSDTVVFPGSLAEVRRVAYLDPMTAFVSPRSNNATICSLPHQPEFRAATPQEAYATFRDLCGRLPEYQYVPTAVGFCLYIKGSILEEFGFFDEIYGRGYNEENDLIMRANRAGFRAVLANRAFVYHIGESSFSTADVTKQLLESKNAQILKDRYPEYPYCVATYLDGVQYQAEQMLAAMLPDAAGRLDVVFDFSTVGPYHNGTFEAAKRILANAAREWKDSFNLFVMVSEEAARFHRLDEVPRVFFVSPETTRVFAIAFRFGQPFDYQQLVRMSRVGVLNIYGMLDTIAYDCLYLNQEDLPVIWGAALQYGDGVIYISEFVRDQFRRRFRLGPQLRELVAYLSLDLADYARPADAVEEPTGYILVIGNAFDHKRVPATVDALSQAFPREKIVAVGLHSDGRRNVVAYRSGSLSEVRMSNLMRGARFIVYPSTYEGFGIPVLESLAHGKPVLARSIPVMREIRAKLAARENLILYDSTPDLVGRLQQGFPEWKAPPEEEGEANDWAAVTRQIGCFLQEAARQWSFSRSLMPRLEYMRLLGERAAGPGRKMVPMTAPGEVGGGSQLLLQSVTEMTRMVRDRDERIEAIHRSLSWRMTSPVRRVGGLVERLFKK